MTALGESACWERLVAARHGVLATLHAERGVDAVPVVYAVDGRRIVLPVDTVKAKRTTALQRRANLAADPRCALLVEHYDDDWLQLWWVRVSGRAVEHEPTARHHELLRARYPQYARPDAIAAVLVLEPDAVTGWTAQPSLAPKTVLSRSVRPPSDRLS